MRISNSKIYVRTITVTVRTLCVRQHLLYYTYCFGKFILTFLFDDT